MVEMHKFPCKFNPHREETLPCINLTELKLVITEVNNLRKTVEEEKKVVEELRNASDQEKKKKEEFGKAVMEMLKSQIDLSRSVEAVQVRHMEAVQVYIGG